MNSNTSEPPQKSHSIYSDIRFFLFANPEKSTLIRFNSAEVRENFSKRILQRMGIDTESYSVLNMHQIGINAPLRYVYEDLYAFHADASYWPTHIATMDTIKGTKGVIRFFLFGKLNIPFFSKIFRLKKFQLFKLQPEKIQGLPDAVDFDNARFLLFKCSGGYPIGFFAIYARSSVAEQNEKDPTQLFFIVGFNFYGKRILSKIWLLNRAWELLHNRVTSNVLSRYKQLCEWKINQIQKGLKTFN